MAGYKDLKVWQKSMDLAVEIYQLVKNLPKEETYGLGDQMRRAAVSIPSNIAEGHGRGADIDFSRFLSIAQGSKSELETQLELCNRLGFLSLEQTAKSLSLLAEIGKMLTVMIRNKRNKPHKS